MATPHWHVLGAGAIGCLFAQALHASGSPTTLVLRRSETPQPQLLPVIVERDACRVEEQLPAITPDTATTISHLLVTTKAYDALDAVAGIAHLLNDNCVVLLLINGMGLAEQLAAQRPKLNIYCGTTTEGAYTISARHIRHAGRGGTRIGQQGLATAPDWFGPWSRATQNCLWDDNITSALWSKLAINCIINPLTAIHRCRNGELAQRNTLAAEVTQLTEEVAAISRAAGFLEVAQNLPSAVAAVLAGTANNRSSMLQDVESGRPTEIDYITGYLVKIADQHGIRAPHNQALLQRIKTLAY